VILRLSREQCERIVALAQQGAKNAEIARAVGCAKSTVAEFLERKGIVVSRIDANLTWDAISLMSPPTSLGFRTVARRLGLPHSVCRNLQRLHHLRARGHHPPTGDGGGFCDAVRAIAAGNAPRQPVKYLAARFGLHTEKAGRLAREILGVKRFKSGPQKIPLQAADDAPSAIDVAADRRAAGG
jgi:hypothetical protein